MPSSWAFNRNEASPSVTSRVMAKAAIHSRHSRRSTRRNVARRLALPPRSRPRLRFRKRKGSPQTVTCMVVLSELRKGKAIYLSPGWSCKVRRWVPAEHRFGYAVFPKLQKRLISGVNCSGPCRVHHTRRSAVKNRFGSAVRNIENIVRLQLLVSLAAMENLL